MFTESFDEATYKNIPSEQSYQVQRRSLPMSRNIVKKATESKYVMGPFVDEMSLDEVEADMANSAMEEK